MKTFLNPWHAPRNSYSPERYLASDHPILYRGAEIHGQPSSVIVVVNDAVVTERVTVSNAKDYIDRYADGTMPNYELQWMRKCQEKAKQ